MARAPRTDGRDGQAMSPKVSTGVIDRMLGTNKRAMQNKLIRIRKPS